METYTLSHFPAQLSLVHVALYMAVTNAPSLRARIIKAATTQGVEGDHERSAVNFAFVDARLITGRLHVQTAIYQAILAESQGSLRTKTVHSEILWALNPSNNITEAIRRYGVSDTTTALFVIRVTSPDLTDVEVKMNAVVSGTLSPLSSLNQLTDWPSIRKYHKLNTEPAIKEAVGDSGREHAIVDNIVVSTVAMKSVMA
ncbi:hypothetical protein PILCRDRAFT_823362 [Piloderma croceum F 1598]|uniref:EKC/KEOPS complex subunit CGI121 n=1 Tax=Piloderma croceum (strain F 1598) TaxID=765440 RepID=A0A0C3BQ65_PILCF|nr:hypothetical protein PILCRDRAFT_823362 [Piloderma croceum F 1598]